MSADVSRGASEAPSESAYAARDARDAWIGVAPLFGFLLVHTVTTATGIASRARFDATFLEPSLGFARAGLLTGIAFVVVPLIFKIARGALLRGGLVAPAAAAARVRRVAAAVTLAFVIWHLSVLPVRATWLGIGAGSVFDALAATLSSTTLGLPLAALAYLAGLAAAAYDVAASLLHLAATSPRIAARAKVLRGGAWAAGGLGALIFLLGANTVVFFATGSRLLPSSAVHAGAR